MAGDTYGGTPQRVGASLGGIIERAAAKSRGKRKRRKPKTQPAKG